MSSGTCSFIVLVESSQSVQAPMCEVFERPRLVFAPLAELLCKLTSTSPYKIDHSSGVSEYFRSQGQIIEGPFQKRLLSIGGRRGVSSLPPGRPRALGPGAI